MTYITGTLTVPTLADAEHLIAAANAMEYELDPQSAPLKVVNDALDALLTSLPVTPTGTDPHTAADFPMDITIGRENGSTNAPVNYFSDRTVLDGHVTGHLDLYCTDGDMTRILYTPTTVTTISPGQYFPADPASVTDFLTASLAHLDAATLRSILDTVTA